MSALGAAATPQGIAVAVQSALALSAILVALIVLRHTRRRFALAERQARDLQAGLERHLAERTAELRASEARLRRTLDSMMEGCQIIGFDWRYVYLNPAAAAHGRRTVADLVGRTMMEAYAGIETTVVFAAIGRCLADRVASRMENEFTYPDGARGWFQLSIEPVPEGALILSVDVTEHKAMAEALRRAVARGQATPQGIGPGRPTK